MFTQAKIKAHFKTVVTVLVGIALLTFGATKVPFLADVKKWIFG